MFTIVMSIRAMNSPIIVTPKISHLRAYSSSTGGFVRSRGTVARLLVVSHSHQSSGLESLGMEDAMPLGRGVSVPLREVDVRVSRSSGPGGQHANVTAS